MDTNRRSASTPGVFHRFPQFSLRHTSIPLSHLAGKLRRDERRPADLRIHCWTLVTGCVCWTQRIDSWTQRATVCVYIASHAQLHITFTCFTLCQQKESYCLGKVMQEYCTHLPTFCTHLPTYPPTCLLCFHAVAWTGLKSHESQHINANQTKTRGKLTWFRSMRNKFQKDGHWSVSSVCTQQDFL